ncbi:hypothetical protein [Kitasatospora kifunensis]|uniref:Tetratricopeptide repeat protein n=1 Tax=Kitasatospora kifunensis TaxID=58351 RepID=A0A7W7QYD9_KITKI|nr:hypothetical protein [Kitasatospora kifunensis]MBB4922068.1 hypothetical protein [Kitasatospora kifunensis]
MSTLPAVPAAPAVPPIEVPCPQCTVPADQQSLRCPSCHEDLAALVRLRYAARIDYNEALTHLRCGDTPSALVLLRRALTTEPDLRPALDLLATLTARTDPAKP